MKGSSTKGKNAQGSSSSTKPGFAGAASGVPLTSHQRQSIGRLVVAPWSGSAASAMSYSPHEHIGDYVTVTVGTGMYHLADRLQLGSSGIRSARLTRTLCGRRLAAWTTRMPGQACQTCTRRLYDSFLV